MKIKGYERAKSSFLSVNKDMSIIIDKILKNDRLKKLLYYTIPDAERKTELTEDETLSLINKNIRIIPKLSIDGEVLAYIIISFDNFIPTGNPEFRDNTISFDIICHFDQWLLHDSKLRPYELAGEIDAMFDDSRLTGIGKLSFLGASQLILNDEFAGITLLYQATHGEEDKVNPLNPMDNV